MDGIRMVICDRLLDDPDDPTIPQMLEALRQWREKERAESKEQCDSRGIDSEVLL